MQSNIHVHVQCTTDVSGVGLQFLFCLIIYNIIISQSENLIFCNNRTLQMITGQVSTLIIFLITKYLSANNYNESPQAPRNIS